MKKHISEIIDINTLRSILEKFANIIGTATAVLDMEGKVIIASGWQDACSKFHRVQADSCKNCLQSDTVLANRIIKGEAFSIYKCLNGMTDAAVPININGEQFGTLFIGQFLLQEPDNAFFRAQAIKFKFDEKKYIDAISKVAVISEDEVKRNMAFLTELAAFIGEIGLNNLKLQSLTENQEKIIQTRTRELIESEGRWQYALEGAGDGMWDWNLKTNDLYFSDRWKTMLGYDLEDIPNGLNTWKDLIHPDDKQNALNDFTNHIEGMTSFYQNEQRLKRKDGTYCWILNRGKVISYDEDGKPLRFIGTHADISVLKKTQEDLKKSQIATFKSMEEAHKSRRLAEEANIELSELMNNLKRSNQELEQFAYVASHDLQEPLRMVSSFTQLLQRRYQDKLDEDANEFIHYAVDGANRMQKLINDLLDYSRITTRGKEFTIVDTSRILGYVISNLQELINENTALITNDDLPIIKADESQILRVFQNLIHNALKFKSKSELPKIHISCKTINNFYEFSVKDNGIGMDMQYHDKVFTIFQRLHSKEEYPGTGIGLSICKRIVERHKGKIWFESILNKGTTFYFTLKII